MLSDMENIAGSEKNFFWRLIQANLKASMDTKIDMLHL